MEQTKYICLFHTRDHAAAALKDIEELDILRGAVTVIAKRDETYGEGYRYNAAEDLATIGVPDRDLKHLQDGVNDGGVILVVDSVPSHAGQIEGIFHRHAAEKIDEADVAVADTYAEPIFVPAAAVVPTEVVVPAGYDTVTPVEYVNDEDVDVEDVESAQNVRVFRRLPPDNGTY